MLNKLVSPKGIGTVNTGGKKDNRMSVLLTREGNQESENYLQMDLPTIARFDRQKAA